MQKIIIVDYGMGNIQSLVRKFQLLKNPATVSSDPGVISHGDKIILPGVGHFGKAMAQIRAGGLEEILRSKVEKEKTPLLGICLGMQLLGRRSEEGNEEGFGWINGSVGRFNFADRKTFKVPHIGWNTVEVKKDSRLFSGISSGDEFYFVHSYHYQSTESGHIGSTTAYGYEFVSAVENENVFGVQFHPEKSHKSGLKLLQNFLDI